MKMYEICNGSEMLSERYQNSVVLSVVLNFRNVCRPRNCHFKLWPNGGRCANGCNARCWEVMRPLVFLRSTLMSNYICLLAGLFPYIRGIAPKWHRLGYALNTLLFAYVFISLLPQILGFRLKCLSSLSV